MYRAHPTNRGLIYESGVILVLGNITEQELPDKRGLNPLNPHKVDMQKNIQKQGGMGMYSCIDLYSKLINKS